MGHDWNFEAAAECWLTLRTVEGATERELSNFEDAESYLLKHRPRSGGEADMLIQVVMDQGGERNDGLDRRALENLRDYVRSVGKTVQFKGSDLA